MRPIAQRWERWKPHVKAAVLLLALTLAVTWPMARDMDTRVPTSDQSIRMVSYLNLWTLAWNQRWFANPGSIDYWESNIFYPHRFTFGYSEPQFLLALLAWPVAALSGNTILGYNFVYLACIWSGAFLMYAFVQQILPAEARGRWVASVAAAILFGFNPYVFRELGVLQLSAIGFPVLALLGMHRFLRAPTFLNSFLFAAGFVGSWYSCAYYGMFLVPLLALQAAVALLAARPNWTLVWRGAILAMACALLILPLAHGMAAAKSSMGLTRSPELVARLSAAFSDYWRLPANSVLYGRWLQVGQIGQTHFVGLFLVAFSLLGATVIVTSARRGNSTPNAPAQSGLHYVILAVFALLLSLGMGFAPTSREGLGIFTFTYWLSPYNLLYEFLPGYSSIRSAYRFAIFVALFLAILSAYGIAWAGSRLPKHFRAPGAALLLGLICLELWPAHIRSFRAASSPEIASLYAKLSALPEGGSILELPLGDPAPHKVTDAGAYMYWGMAHWRPLVNGYSGFAPGAFADFSRSLREQWSVEKLTSAMDQFSVRGIVVHWSELTPAQSEAVRRLLRCGAREIARAGSISVLENSAYKGAPHISLPTIKSVSVTEGAEPSTLDVRVTLSVPGGKYILATPWFNSIRAHVKLTREDGSGSIAPAIDQTRPVGSRLFEEDASITITLPQPTTGKYAAEVSLLSDRAEEKRTGYFEIDATSFIDSSFP